MEIPLFVFISVSFQKFSTFPIHLISTSPGKWVNFSPFESLQQQRCVKVIYGFTIFIWWILKVPGFMFWLTLKWKSVKTNKEFVFIEYQFIGCLQSSFDEDISHWYMYLTNWSLFLTLIVYTTWSLFRILEPKLHICLSFISNLYKWYQLLVKLSSLLLSSSYSFYNFQEIFKTSWEFWFD